MFLYLGTKHACIVGGGSLKSEISHFMIQFGFFLKLSVQIQSQKEY